MKYDNPFVSRTKYVYVTFFYGMLFQRYPEHGLWLLFGTFFVIWVMEKQDDTGGKIITSNKPLTDKEFAQIRGTKTHKSGR